MLLTICLIFPSLFSSGTIISSTFLEFSSGFAILSPFPLVTASAILFPKNSPALWTTFLDAYSISHPVSNNFLQMIKIHIL